MEDGILSNVTNKNLEDPSTKTTIPKIIICIVLFTIVIITIIGNLLVLASPIVNRKLRNTFTYFILNLAVTDLLVGVTAMSFYAFDTLLGYWPFGEVMCGIWIFFDYGMTFASVFTLVVISLDRFWSVQWSLHYRAHNTNTKCAVMIIGIWVAVLAIWVAPCTLDRIRWSEPNFCMWEPSKNPYFVVFIAVVGHHTPCVIIIASYIKIYLVMRSRQLKVGNIHSGKDRGNPSNEDTTINSFQQQKRVIFSTENTLTIHTELTSCTSQNHLSVKSSDPRSVEASTSGTEINKKRRDDRDKKAFRMLSYILFSYLICWLPFHIVFDISSINPDLVPQELYTFTFWLAYFNSTLNPLVYALTSQSFRNAFVKILKFQCKTL